MHKKIFSTILLAVILTSFFNSGFAKGSPSPSTPVSNPASQELPADTIDLYMPMVLRPRSQTVYGVETFNFSDTNLGYANAANVYWVRAPFFRWKDIEPVKGTYNWNAVDQAGLLNLVKYNYQLIATVKYTPSWAWKYPGFYCGPPSQSALPDFARFMKDLVTKYSAPPYNIRYWEIGNEPDVDPYVAINMEPDNVFGCWGDNSKTYYGGEYYADMLKLVYPAIKQASPDSKVLIGGLLLDCDPVAKPKGKECKSSRFLEGILHNGGAPYFDIVSFHSYIWGGNVSITEREADFWPNGGQILGKVNYLRSLTNKPLLMTEFALRCAGGVSCTDPSETFFGFKADAVVSSYVRSMALGLMGEIWYTLEDTGWDHTGLFHEGNPTPGYDAMVFLTNELFGASYNSEITTYPGLRGYKFIHPEKEIRILWAPDGATGVTINVPPGVDKIYDRVGTPIEPVPAQILITHPTYLEIPTQ